jgi:hypothetical protein
MSTRDFEESIDTGVVTARIRRLVHDLPLDIRGKRPVSTHSLGMG